eukprot:gene8115-5651_t
MTYLTNPSAPATPPARHTGAGVQHRHMMIDSNNIVVMTTRDITHCRPSLTPRCPSHPPARCVVVSPRPGLLQAPAAPHPTQVRNAPRLHQQHLIGRGVRPQRMASHDEVVCQIPHARLQQQQQQPSAVVIVVVWIYRSSSFRTPQDSQALRMKLVRKISLPTLSPYDTKYCRPSLMPLPPRTVCGKGCVTPASWTLTRLKTTFALSDRAVFHTPASALPPHASRGALSRGRTASSCSGTAPCLGVAGAADGAIEQGARGVMLGALVEALMSLQPTMHDISH